MSFLSSLEACNFRNFSNLKIDRFSPQFNLIYGENGSGKTNLLEAIYHLSLGRSFRTRLVSRIVRYDSEKFSIFGKVLDIPIGIEKSTNGAFNIRVAGEDIFSAAKLAEIFPVQFINPDIHQLITAGPQYRRQFVDWGVFHVEHEVFLQLWKNAQRIIKQRNAALKLGKNSKREVILWDSELVKASYLIDKSRRVYIEAFEPVFFEMIDKLLGNKKINIKFYSGWDEKKDYQEVLERSLVRDFQFGHTLHGPHRADLRVYVDKIPAQDVLSRGQQKLLACAMRLTQAILLKKINNENCVLLVDDFAAELDEQRRRAFCNVLGELQTQIFATSTELQLLADLFDVDSSVMFHVEHGGIREREG
jgi:DNA replication and repair protein RecF